MRSGSFPDFETFFASEAFKISVAAENLSEKDSSAEKCKSSAFLLFMLPDIEIPRSSAASGEKPSGQTSSIRSVPVRIFLLMAFSFNIGYCAPLTSRRPVFTISEANDFHCSFVNSLPIS